MVFPTIPLNEVRYSKANKMDASTLVFNEVMPMPLENTKKPTRNMPDLTTLQKNLNSQFYDS